MKEYPMSLIFVNVLIIAAVMFFFDIEVNTKTVLVACFVNAVLYTAEIFYLIKIKKIASND